MVLIKKILGKKKESKKDKKEIRRVCKKERERKIIIETNEVKQNKSESKSKYLRKERK